MLPKGSISKVYEYYFTNLSHSDNVLRAMREFFDRFDFGWDDYLKTDEKGRGLFNEWFLYDFAFTSGKTILANFIEENPLQLPEEEMTLYKKLLESNKYGIFEVLSVDIDKGLAIQDLETEKDLYVRERKLTLQVKPGALFFGRVGRVDNHYELIGADAFSLQGVKEVVKNFFQQREMKITPKMAYEIWKER